ncbi:hypothetical protein HQQ81_16810 [Microbacteriaceae bacterium VKM Ac-2854]|nr:hypothetical protein [Microbacteriaceae bacterium VKM Ac-2854]
MGWVRARRARLDLALAEAIVAACAHEDHTELAPLLRPRVRVTTAASARTVPAKDAAASILEAATGREPRQHSVNGRPALVLRRAGRVEVIIVLATRGARVAELWIVTDRARLLGWNPEGPVTDPTSPWS